MAGAAPFGVPEDDDERTAWYRRPAQQVADDRAAATYADWQALGAPQAQDASAAGEDAATTVRDAAVPPQSVTPKGRAFIMQRELKDDGSVALDIAPDTLGNPTFGYGHKVSPAEAPALKKQLAGLTAGQRLALAEKMFDADVATAYASVVDRLGADTVAKLGPQHIDALTADTFNAGRAGALGGRMMQKIWDGDLPGAGGEFNAWYGTDQKTHRKVALRGLARRSLQEAAIFNRGDYGAKPTDAEIDAAMASGVSK